MFTSAFCAATFTREASPCAQLPNTPCSRKPSNPWCSSSSSKQRQRKKKAAGRTKDSRVGAVRFFWQQEGPPRQHARLVTCHSLPQHLPRGPPPEGYCSATGPPFGRPKYLYVYIYTHASTPGDKLTRRFSALTEGKKKLQI